MNYSAFPRQRSATRAHGRLRGISDNTILKPDAFDTYRFRSKIQVVEGSLGGDFYTCRLGTTNHVHGVGRGQVHDVTVLAELFAHVNHGLDCFVLELARSAVQEGRVLCGLL
jgi:hypothetical protein